MGYFKEHGNGIRRVAASVMLLFVLLLLTGGMGSQKFYLPLFTYAAKGETGPAVIFGESLMNMMPICAYSRENMGDAVLFAREQEEILPEAGQEDDEEDSFPAGEAENIQSAEDLPQDEIGRAHV